MHSLVSAVFAALAEHLEPLGFSFDEKRNRFARSKGNRTEVFAFRVMNDRPGHRISPTIGIRFEECEAIFHRSSGFERQYHEGTMTVGMDLEIEFSISRRSDVNNVVEELVRIFQQSAEPYFKSFTSIEDVDKALNDDPAKASEHAPNVWLRCSAGAIAARLAGRPEFAELAETYRKRVAKLSRGFYLSNFEKLLADLSRPE